MRIPPLLPILALLAWPGAALAADPDAGRRWQAGDHHVHSEWSVDWDRTRTPPAPVRGGDSPYARARNARHALANGLSWMVHTDHGGPGHSAVTRDHAWPALQEARREVPALIQFNGMEFDVPAGEHASLIIAPGPHERDQLVAVERDFSRSEPLQPGTRDDSQTMLDALAYMRSLPSPPLMLINHPSRTATAVGQWGDVQPAELMAWHDAAPRVLVGMEGAPGHQAATAHRGLYRNAAAPTFGGFDQMTAEVGGVWDRMLARGRRFWITATSDSHVNVRDGGRDFDPGEYSKTYVWARHDAGDILDGVRDGRMFAVTGDLIDALELRVHAQGDAARHARMGGTLQLPASAPMRIELRVRRPAGANAHGERPALHHVDLIVGAPDAGGGVRAETRRIDASGWTIDGAWHAMSWTIPAPPGGGFVRVRGTTTAEASPLADTPGEDPWQDLWFYSNPVFIETTD